MFGCAYIGTEHLAFALAETDDAVGHLLANAIDRDAIRERLGSVSGAPRDEMVFTPGAKRTIEKSFENARRLGHNYIGTGHLALGVLDSTDPPPLLPGCDVEKLRAALADVESRVAPSQSGWKAAPGSGETHPVTNAMLSTLAMFNDLSRPGTRVTISIARPDGDERTWSWTYEENQ